jgi:hypothetical protein
MPGGVTVTVGGETPKVTRVSIRRGRADELDRTGTGQANVSLVYTGGTISDYVGADVSVVLANPHGGSGTVFTGIVDDQAYSLRPSQVATDVELTCVDALDFFAGIELAPGVNGILPLPAAVDDGNIFYEQQLPGPLGGSTVLEGRIGTAIDESGWGGPVELFSGNVQVRDTIYSPRTSLLTVIQDAADAEFPGVANFFVQGDGTVTFHGRLARFNPSDPQYNIETFTAGDGAACVGNSGMARINRVNLGSSRQRIINAALATPQGIADADIENQIVTDATSISTYGLRSWSAENLLTWFDELNGPFGGTAQEEANAATLQFAQYYVDNYASPQIRVEGLTFRSRRPEWANSAATWALMCGADISDILTLTVSNPGITLSAVDYFIEGIRMELEPLNGDYANVTATYDLSPRAYWDTDF